MNLLKITDVGNGRILISCRRGCEERHSPQPIPFANPLSPADRVDLRWYLEKFLSFPYGAERWRAERVEEKMAKWGEALFAQVFPKCDFNPDPHSLYQ